MKRAKNYSVFYRPGSSALQVVRDYP